MICIRWIKTSLFQTLQMPIRTPLLYCLLHGSEFSICLYHRHIQFWNCMPSIHGKAWHIHTHTHFSLGDFFLQAPISAATSLAGLPCAQLCAQISHKQLLDRRRTPPPNIGQNRLRTLPLTDGAQQQQPTPRLLTRTIARCLSSSTYRTGPTGQGTHQQWEGRRSWSPKIKEEIHSSAPRSVVRSSPLCAVSRVCLAFMCATRQTCPSTTHRRHHRAHEMERKKDVCFLVCAVRARTHLSRLFAAPWNARIRLCRFSFHCSVLCW